MKITVLGAGAWGTALALLYARDHGVSLWVFEREQYEGMLAARENRQFLPGFALPPAIVLEHDITSAVRGADLNLVVTPLTGLRGALRALRQAAPATPVIWACKGLEQDSARLPHQIVAEELGENAPCGVLSGPSFAVEIARGLPAAVTLASRDPAFARHWAAALNSPRLRLYANGDVIGVEVGGAVKNVMAIATGIADGMGFGLNARAALMTRGLAEIARMGQALGGKRETFMGLAGMGDLILTCTGDLSRNRRVGLGLAQGKSLDEILREIGQTAEGVSTAREVAKLAQQLGIDMPIIQAVASILFDGLAAKAVVEQLLSRDPKVE